MDKIKEIKEKIKALQKELYIAIASVEEKEEFRSLTSKFKYHYILDSGIHKGCPYGTWELKVFWVVFYDYISVSFHDITEEDEERRVTLKKLESEGKIGILPIEIGG